MERTAPTVLLMPGINNSGPTHWQSLWEKSDPSFRRILVPDWDKPVFSDWIDAIDRMVRSVDGPALIVAHSLGCLPVAEWAMRSVASAVHGVMLVSVPDPDGPNFPAEAQGFRRLLPQPLPFAAIVVSSEDDPYGSSEYARQYAEAWGSRFVNIGKAGHINAHSKLGVWEEGRRLLESLRE